MNAGKRPSMSSQDSLALTNRPPSREVGGPRPPIGTSYVSPLVTSAPEAAGTQPRILPMSGSKGAFPVPPPPAASIGGRPGAVGNQVFHSNSPSGSLTRPVGTLTESITNSNQTLDNAMAGTINRARFGSEISTEMAGGGQYHSSPAHVQQNPVPTTTPHRGGMFPLSVGCGSQKWDSVPETGIYGHSMGSETIPLRQFGLDDVAEDRRTLNSTTALSVVSGSMPPIMAGPFQQPHWLAANSYAPPASKSVSALYAMLFALIGVVLLSAKVFTSTHMRDLYIDIFAVYMFGCGLLACVYLCLANLLFRKSSCNPNTNYNPITASHGGALDQPQMLDNSGVASGAGNVMFDHSNGSFYSKMALALFFLSSFAHIVLNVIENLQKNYSTECYTLLHVAVLGLALFFQFAQLILILLFSKCYITSCSGLARVCISHTIAANLFYWMLALCKETEESLTARQSSGDPNQIISVVTGECSRKLSIFAESTSVISKSEEQMSFLLYTSTTGFVLYSCSILYRLWLNTGKKAALLLKKKMADNFWYDPMGGPNKSLVSCNFKTCEIICGFGVGFVALFSCSGAIVIDKISTGDSNNSVTLYYHVAVCLIWLAVLVFMVPLATCIIKGHPKSSRGVVNWMNQPVLAVTSIAALSYAVFNSMSALLQLIDGNRIGVPVSGSSPVMAPNVRDPQKSSEVRIQASSASAEVVNSEVEQSLNLALIASSVFLLNVLRSVEIILQSIYLTDAMTRRVTNNAANLGLNDGYDNDDENDSDDDNLSWSEKASSSRVFVVLFLFINLALSISTFYEIIQGDTMNEQQVHFYGVVNWSLFIHLVGPFVCLYRVHSTVCLLDLLQLAF